MIEPILVIADAQRNGHAIPASRIANIRVNDGFIMVYTGDLDKDGDPIWWSAPYAENSAALRAFLRRWSGDDVLPIPFPD